MGWKELEGLLNGALGGLVVAGITLWWETRRTRSDRREKDAERKAELACRLRVFAVEAVGLLERWVQYMGQSLKELSFSQPFEFTSPEQVNELMKLGASQSVLEAIYKIKALNSDVTNQVRWAQEVYFKVQADGSLTDLQRAERSTVAIETFGRSSAFIKAEWDVTSKAVATVIDAAKAEGLDVTELSQKYQQNNRKYLNFIAPGPFNSAAKA